MQKHALIVEDDPDIAPLIAMHLSDINCASDICNDGRRALDIYKAGTFDLVVLDLMLPGLDGLSVCREIRSQPGYVPILMLTAKSSEFDRVLGLEVGADDYLAKPFSIHELQARVKALFRRVDAMRAAASDNGAQVAAPSASPDGTSQAVAGPAVQGKDLTAEPLVHGPLSIDQQRRLVTLDGKAIELTAKEFDLLYYFAAHPGFVFTRAQLLDQVWGYNHEGYEHTVNTHINRLRAKVEEDPSKPAFIQTVWGVGYKFAE